MIDYEANFWLPFMGTTRPVYAIPGNHDWYDALEGFAATFLEPDAARASMRARVEVDNRVTSTTDGRIEQLIAEASRLRKEYGVPTHSSAPLLRAPDGSFALFAIDTGVLQRSIRRRPGSRPRSSDRRGKLKMAVLGHPFYAGGHYAAGPARFAASAAPAPARCDDPDGGRHARSGVLRRAGPHALRHGAPLRQWRRWRYLSLGRRSPGRRSRRPPTGRTTRATRWRARLRPDALVEAAGLVVDAAFRCVAVRRRVALRRLRRQCRAVFSELHRGQGGTFRESRSSHPVRGAWAPDLGKSGVLTEPQDRERKRSRARRVGRSHARRHYSALTDAALRVSNAIAIVMLFLTGYAFEASPGGTRGLWVWGWLLSGPFSSA